MQVSDEPLRVAIAGRLKAGKSTLVNALIGRRVAPTAAGECTRVVTRFRYGSADRVDVVLRNGERRSLPLDDDGMIPQRLGVSAAQVAYVDVTLTSAKLRELTVVDTPGLASTDTAVSAPAPRQAVGTSTAPFDADIDADSASEVAAAEAVVYVFTQAVRADDVRALEAFRAASARLASSPINALGVFGKVDTLVGGAGDPWPVAGPLAEQQAALLARTVSEVVPVVGSARRDRRGRAAHQRRLRRPAAAGRGAGDLAGAAGLGGPVPDPARAGRAPSTASGCWSCSTCTASASRSRSSPPTRSWAPVSWCAGWCRRPGSRGCAPPWSRRSGGARTPSRPAGRWRGWNAWPGTPPARDDREALRDGVEQLLREPDYHRLRLLEVAQRVATGAVPMPVAWEQELTRLATSDDARWILRLPDAGADQLAEAALEAANRWRVYAVAGAGPAQSRVAQVAHRGFYLLSRQVRP